MCYAPHPPSVEASDITRMASYKRPFLVHISACRTPGSHFEAYCTQVVEEIVTVAHSTGQPAESGLKCKETKQMKRLDLTHPDAIKLISCKRDRLKRALKDNTLALVDSQDRSHIEGYALDGKDPAENLYRQKAILLLVALHILKLIPHEPKHSLVDLFPDQYETIPEHYVAMACAMLVIRFRLCFPDHQIPKITAHILQREAYFQLVLLRMARMGNSPEAIELNQWMRTSTFDPRGSKEDKSTVVQWLCEASDVSAKRGKIARD
ncbi:uncharacterized protein EDB93DRAFT_1102370 [Suillus bovinus]|uniref:uncharacterized protein n=1 Tax=Suillus bovinus TaxID=48563 RepID=UPI001B8839CB|nr:uncharacterized protein EDB93DRAFT_1102370 [Suillus bovinus]KAG2154229.1 hypothetical protein EDB93DRAFT_1102370 [Suillus bovinus]